MEFQSVRRDALLAVSAYARYCPEIRLTGCQQHNVA
jgi:hypothetical protein